MFSTLTSIAEPVAVIPNVFWIYLFVQEKRDSSLEQHIYNRNRL